MSRLLKEDFYVDDLLAGADSIEELQIKRTKIIEALQLNGLSLSKWNSNHQLFRASNQQQIQLNVDQAQCTKTLGTIWNVFEDTFMFKLLSFVTYCNTPKNFISGNVDFTT